MKKSVAAFIILLCLLVTEVSSENRSLKNNIPTGEPYTREYEINMKRDILCLMAAYPGYIIDVKQLKDGFVYLVMKSGKLILYDDKRQKNFEQKLKNADIQDMMEQIYPLNDIKYLMPSGSDPGRIRVYPLLNEVYGNSKEKVESNLTAVRIGYKKLPFNRSNEAADALQKVMDELVMLNKKQNNLYRFIFPVSGTFNYRYIAGTKLLSPHSYGIAIDLASDKSDYWRWTSRRDGQRRLDSYPREIVHVFEKNNFIWGGKWSHFDILHFEYRPELILKSMYFSQGKSSEEPWHHGFPDNPSVKNYIELIDRCFIPPN